MLLEEIKASRDLGEKSISSSISEQRYNDINYFRDELYKLIPEIKRKLNQSKNIKCIITVVPDEANRLLTELITLKNESKSLSYDRIISEIDELKYCVKQLGEKLEDIWIEYKNENFTPQANMVRSLDSIIQNNKTLDELNTLYNTISSTTIGDYNTLNNINNYRKLSADLIKGLKMSPDIEKFIMRLAQGDDLLLDDLNSEIMSWLVEHNISKRIKLIIE